LSILFATNFHILLFTFCLVIFYFVSYAAVSRGCKQSTPTLTFNTFNVKRTIWLKGYQNGNHIKPSEQRMQEISIAKN